MFRLKNKDKCPPHGFQWIDPVTTMLIEARNYPNWLSKAIEHRQGMLLSMPVPEEMEDQICGRMDDHTRKQYCSYCDGSQVSQIIGVGGTLKSMLANMGVHACWGCIDLARKMDDWGPDGCEAHMEEIVQTMQHNAEKRNWFKFVPFREQGSELLARIAIKTVRDRLSYEIT